jgi:hypothetical protein
MSDYYQRMGQEAVESAGGNLRKLLLHADVEDGVISADIFFQKKSIVSFLQKKSSVRFRFTSEKLQDLIYEFWERGDTNVAPRSWRVMQFTVLDDKFTVDFIYPDQIDLTEAASDRRARIVARHFPDCEVDYSKPNG